MTPNREDYLKIIYSLKEKEGKVTNKMIASYLKIAPSSVSEMLKKLKKKNLIDIKNNLVILTEAGTHIATKVITTHRIWETFLINKIGFDIEKAHDQAELLEHVTSDELLAKLNDYLEYPKTSPFGKPIYINKPNEEKELL